MKNTASIIIDVQKGLFYRDRPIYKAEQLINNINSLISYSRVNEMPLFFIYHETKRMLKKDTEGWQSHPILNVDTKKDNFLSKTKGSLFIENDIAQKLKADGIDNLLMMGLFTHTCVKTNCLEAQKLGFNVILAKDAHSNYHAEPKKIIETWNRKLKEAAIEVISTEQIIKGNR